MKLTLAYGCEGLPLEVPEDHPGVTVLRKQDPPPLSDPAAAIRATLARPVESAPLAAMAAGRRDAVVVISDITRPVPNPVLLPPVLETLEAAGIPRAAITILIATGMHRPNEGEELVRLVGADIARDYRVINHLSREPGELRYLGDTRAGIPVHVNRHYLDADLKVLTGFIEPHLWAGFSGGTKAVLPGVSGIETMRHMHGYAMVAHPAATYGMVEGNPFREACWEVAQMAGADFLVNVTVGAAGEITGVFAGHPREAHRAGAAFLAPLVTARVAQPVDLAITTCGGDPLDRNLYQTVKGMSGVAPILRPRGRMVVASACGEGAGSPEFQSLMDEARSPEDLLARLRAPGFFRRDQWAAQEICSLLLKHSIGLKCAGFDAARLRGWFLDAVADPQAVLDEALARGESIAVVPEGPYVLTETG